MSAARPTAEVGSAATAGTASPTGRRPTPPGGWLDVDTLVQAAAELADEEGWNALTLSRVAERVDRHISSLYTHVDGLDDLRVRVARLSIGELADVVWAASIGRSSGDALRAIALAERDWARAHPGRFAALQSMLGVDDAEYRAAGRRLATPLRLVLASFGLDEDRTGVAHTVFSATVRGLVEPTSGDDTTLDAAVELFVTALVSGAWPPG